MIRTGLAILFIALAYGWAGQSDMEAQDRADAHQRETIAAAKAEFKQRQRTEILLQQTDQLTSPIFASNTGR